MPAPTRNRRHRLAAYRRCSAGARVGSARTNSDVTAPTSPSARRGVSAPSPARHAPSWLPEDEAGQVDLSELAAPSESVKAECARLERLLEAHVAVYRPGARARPSGLCSRFRFALLDDEQMRRLAEAERRQSDVVFVAYARPLTRW